MSARLAAFDGCGIELEYMIVDRVSLDVVPIADRLLADIAGEVVEEAITGELGVSNELALHVIEVKNPFPARFLPSLVAPFKDETQRLDEVLASYGARLLGTGMHPWMNPREETRLWPHAGAPIYQSYDAIFDCRRHGWSNIQSMHINLPFANDEEFERLHAAVRLVLPLVPALAASSPLVEGASTGYLDYRLVAYRDHQSLYPETVGSVIPETVRSEAEYRERILEPMYQSIAPEDQAGVLQNEWLNARGAIPRFDRGAIEIRLADTQECPIADLAIAGAIVGAVEAIYRERWGDLAAQQAISTSSLDTILRACVRDADHAQIDDPTILRAWGASRTRATARDVWSWWMANIDPGPWGGVWETLLAEGPLGRRILRALDHEDSASRIRDVYGELGRCLDEGMIFREAFSRSPLAAHALQG